MGIRDWRGWSRLDALDRRTVGRWKWTETRLKWTGRWLWFLVALLVVAGVLALLERDWVQAALLALVATNAATANEYFLRRVRAGLG